jgi:hypothetical protein
MTPDDSARESRARAERRGGAGAAGRWLETLALLATCACSPAREPAHPVHSAPEARGTAFVAGTAPAQPLIELSLLAFRVADDDGGRPARVTAADVARSVAFANDVYRAAGVRFRFDPRELVPLHNRVINDLEGDQQSDWATAKRAADEVAEHYPDRLVVFFRHGRGPHATGAGFSGTDYNFVVMPGWSDDLHCGHDHISALSHELGHHFGLRHTFARVFDVPSQAADFLAACAGDVRAFDGDGLDDTAPDPGVRTTECQAIDVLELGSVRVPLARRNIMSYYDQPESLSREQIDRLRWFLLERRTHHLKLPRNQPSSALQAEQLEIVAQSGGECWAQGMDSFGAGNWSESRQLFCRSRAGPQSVRVRLQVERAGLQRVELYATRAPDYGILEVLLDGVPLGSAYDAWAPAVLASGAIPLGEVRLEAGRHELSFVTRARNPASIGFHMGLDALVLLPVEPLS